MAGILDLIGGQTPPSAPAEMFVVGNPEGLLEPGNINILARPQVKLPDGSVATVHSMSFQDKDGNEVLVPMVSPDGKMMTQKQAVEFYYKTGQHLGKFKSPEVATSYAERLHNQQAEYYGVK
jgi:hypothetical protein